MAIIYKPIITRIDTTANWTTLNPTPANGEQCIEVLGGGLFKLKVGDGVTPWIALDYYQDVAGQIGDLTKLLTPEKGTLVDAINSIQKQVEFINKFAVADRDYDEDEEELEVSGVIIISDENGDIVLGGTSGEIIPIEYESLVQDVDGHLSYYNGIEATLNEDETLVLDNNVNDQIIPVDVDEEVGE